jgi:O-antigen/teichoic acid export membrane protein
VRPPIDSLSQGTLIEPPESAGVSPHLDFHVIRSQGWLGLSYGGTTLLSMITMALVAHIVPPSVFGVFTLATVLLIFLETAQRGGVADAVIQRRTNMEPAIASAFVFVIAASVVLYVLLFLAAPFLGDVFHTQSLTDVLRVLAIVVFIRSFGLIPGALLERELAYKRRAISELSSAVVQTVVTLALALAGLGVWSLVAGTLVAAAVQTAIVWVLTPARPHPGLARVSVLRDLLRFGRFVSAGRFTELLISLVDKFSVGRILGTTAVGQYSAAFRVGVLPTTFFGVVGSRVMLPALSLLQRDREAFGRMWTANLQRLAFLSLPVATVFVIAAQPIVSGLLGEEWAPAAGPLRVLAIYGTLHAFSATMLPVFESLGRTWLTFAVNVPNAVLVIPAIYFFTKEYGITGTAVGMLVALAPSALLKIVCGARLLRLDVRATLRVLVAPLACTAVVGIAVALALGASSSLSDPLTLAIVVVVAAAAYAAAAYVLARSVVHSLLSSIRPSRG